MSQTCNTCRIDLPVEDYYVQDGYRIFKKCKACIKNAKPCKARVSGFELLAPETRAAIKLDLTNRAKKLTGIALEHGINYPNLCYWVRKNKIV